MSFETLGLAPALLRALSENNYTTATPIQAEAIPLILAGRDLLGGAQTGTGKTAAFALPMLHRMSELTSQRTSRRPRALVLTPTRELAVQVHDSIRKYGKHLRLPSTVIYGGAGMSPQIDALRRGVDILVATPGRLIDHIEQGTLQLGDVQMLVLDEADRMLDMGFLPAIRRVLNYLPKVRQTLLFSATFEEQIKKLAIDFLKNPTEVQVSVQNAVASTVSHRAHPVDVHRKRDLLTQMLAQRYQEQILVFGKTKHGCNRLAEHLEKAGIRSVAIHGNKSQAQRLKALNDFKSGKARVLVATDVAARGLDIPQLPVVINFDLPMVAEDYIHRIGRTGRAGASGEAISLVAPEEAQLLRAIHRVLKADIEMISVPGFETSRAIRMGNDGGRPANNTPRPGGNRPPQKHARRPHAAPGKTGQPASHAHAGPKKHSNGPKRRDPSAQRG
jgi:ATP-dependent RNA helicase RhlE